MTVKAVPGLAALLAQVPTRSMCRRLMRCVPQLDFMASEKPRFLYTSGRLNRCNPTGVECLYFSEGEETAAAELRQTWHRTAAAHQPKLTFTARVRFRRIVDLSDRAVLRVLGLSPEDLYEDWRRQPVPTRLQQLGLAISRQRSITAIRFPSAAARKRGKSGWNVAIFPAALVSPDRVEIVGASTEPLEILPRAANPRTG